MTAIEADGIGLHEAVFQRVGGPVIAQSDYARLLLPRLGAAEEIVGRGAELSPLSVLARGAGIGYRREQRIPRETGLFRLRRSLRRWMRPFYGVATSRLENYLEWFRRDRPIPMPP